jgi:hypothetical protein
LRVSTVTAEPPFCDASQFVSWTAAGKAATPIYLN